MKYIRFSFEYMRRRFGSVLMYSILPAIIFTLTSSPVSIFNKIIELTTLEGANFVNVWLGATELGWQGLLYLILSGLMFIIFTSAFAGLMERDMRLGDLTHQKFFHRVNNNFLIVLKVFIVFVLFLEIFGIINSSLVYLWYKVFSSKEIFITMAVLSVTITTIIFVALASLGILWIPTMVMTGLNMRKSLVESLRLIKGKVFKTVLAIMLPAIPFYGLVMLTNYFDIAWLNFFSELMLNIFACGYYFVLMFVLYFEATGLDREDKKKKIWEVGK